MPLASALRNAPVLSSKPQVNTDTQEAEEPVSKKPVDRDGVCQLTGERGRFLKAHIIPRALAPPRQGGEPFAQIGLRQRPSRRRESWYDPKIVTQAGEDILTAYDTFAIREMRRLKLVWGAWGPMLALSTSDYAAIPGTPWGMRRIQFSDPLRMRLFFLSVLWRAAVSEMAVFQEITLRQSDLRRLRRCVRDGSPPPDDLFPITLTQLSTRGVMHNLGPIAQIKEVPLSGGTPRKVPIFRFYFDGLVAHFHRSPTTETIDGLVPMLVGQPGPTTLSTVTFEASWQLLNLRNTMADAEHDFPGATARAEGRS